MRHFARILIVMLCLLPTLAYAAPGGVKGPPAGKGKDAGGQGQGGPPAGPPAQPGPPPPSQPVVTPAQINDDQDSALSAVEAGDALPLSDISRSAVARWGGRVIDARLIRSGGVLVYQLTLVSDAGTVRRVYVNAKTAAPVGAK